MSGINSDNSGHLQGIWRKLGALSFIIPCIRKPGISISGYEVAFLGWACREQDQKKSRNGQSTEDHGFGDSHSDLRLLNYV